MALVAIFDGKEGSYSQLVGTVCDDDDATDDSGHDADSGDAAQHSSTQGRSGNDDHDDDGLASSLRFATIEVKRAQRRTAV
ncbi:hypothetical protein AAVH_08680 [Aphelenchoides avenae]|nr:hypothetical protein AAVH_08680 [Aphelenchus avenae]